MKTQLLNRTHVRKYALHCAQDKRSAANFSRVSEAFLERCEMELRIYIRQEVFRQPSIGVTIK